MEDDNKIDLKYLSDVLIFLIIILGIEESRTDDESRKSE